MKKISLLLGPICLFPIVSIVSCYGPKHSFKYSDAKINRSYKLFQDKLVISDLDQYLRSQKANLQHAISFSTKFKEWYKIWIKDMNIKLPYFNVDFNKTTNLKNVFYSFENKYKMKYEWKNKCVTKTRFDEGKIELITKKYCDRNKVVLDKFINSFYWSVPIIYNSDASFNIYLDKVKTEKNQIKFAYPLNQLDKLKPGKINIFSKIRKENINWEESKYMNGAHVYPAFKQLENNMETLEQHLEKEWNPKTILTIVRTKVQNYISDNWKSYINKEKFEPLMLDWFIKNEDSLPKVDKKNKNVNTLLGNTELHYISS